MRPMSYRSADDTVTYRSVVAIAAACCLVGFLLLAGCSVDESDPSGAAELAKQAPGSTTPDTAAVHREGMVGVGQTVYIPVYSHIYHQDGTREFNLTTTLSIRNTDPENPITITSVRYHDSSGQLVRQYVEQPIMLAPLASNPYVVEERDKAGGVGANFIVQWQSAVVVSAPIMEAVMISTAGTQGLSFVSRGQVIRPLDAGL